MAQQPAQNPKVATPVNRIPTPKIRFQQSADNAAKHRALIESKDFQRGSDYALLEYQNQLSGLSVDGNGAAALHFKMLGAQEFLQTFRLLGDVFVMPKLVDMDNLKS